MIGPGVALINSLLRDRGCGPTSFDHLAIWLQIKWEFWIEFHAIQGG